MVTNNFINDVSFELRIIFSDPEYVEHDTLIKVIDDILDCNLDIKYETNFKSKLIYDHEVDTHSMLITKRETVFYNSDEHDIVKYKQLDKTRSQIINSFISKNVIDDFVHTITEYTLRTYQIGVFSLISKTKFIKNQIERPRFQRNSSVSPNRHVRMPDSTFEELIKTHSQMYPLDLGFTEFKEASSNINTLVNELRDKFVPSMVENSASFKTVLEDIKEKITSAPGDKFEEEAHRALDSISQFSLGNITKEVYKMIALVLFFSSSVHSSINRNNESYFFLGIATVLVVVLWIDDIKNVFSLIINYTNNKEKKCGIQSQSADLITNAVTGIITTLMGASVGQGNTKDIPKSVLAHLSTFDRSKNALVDIFKYILQGIVLLAEAIGCAEYMPEGFKYAYIAETDIRAICTRVDEFSREMNRCELIVDMSNYLVLDDLLSQIEKHIIDMPRTSKNSGLLSILSDQKKLCREIMKKFDSSFSKNIRQEPVCIVLRGGPGTLKSQALQHMAEAFVVRRAPEELLDHVVSNPSYYMYNRTPECIYWDGYGPRHIVTYIDDFGQFKDVAGNPDCEAVNVVRMINELEAQLHPAELSKKGNLRFNSKFVILTTNAPTFDFQSIVSNKAVLRRFDRTFTVVPKREYIRDEDMDNDLMNIGIDINKLPKGCKDVSSVHPDCLNFFEYSYVTGTHTGNVYSYDQVVEMALTIEERKKLWYEQKESELSDTVSKHLIIRKGIKQVDDELLDSFPPPLATYTVEDIKMMSIDEEEEFHNTIDWWRSGSKTQFIKTKSQMGNINEPVDSIEESLKFFKKASDDDICIIEDAINELGRRIYFEQKSPKYKRYIDTCISVLKSNVQFEGILDHKLLLNIMMSQNPVRFLESVKTQDKGYLIELFSTPANEFKQGWNKLKSKQVTNFSNSISKWFVDSYRSCLTFFHNTLLTFKKWCVDHRNVAIIVASVVALIGFITTICTFFLPRTKTIDVTAEKGDYHLRMKPTVRVIHTPVASQMGNVADRSGCEQVESAIHTNMYLMELLVPERDSQQLGFITFLEGRIALINNHFIVSLRTLYDSNPVFGNFVLKFSRYCVKSDRLNEYFYFVSDFLLSCQTTPELEAKDLHLAYLSKFNLHGSILKLFPTKKESIASKSTECRLLNKGGKQFNSVTSELDQGKNIEANDEFGNFVVHGAYEYRGLTSKGDCGSWLQILDRNARAKIFGIHVAGGDDTYKGYATPITSEELEKGLSLFPLRVKFERPIIAESQIGIDFQDKFPIIEITDLPNNICSKSNIVRTELYGAWTEPKTKPCMLKPFTNSLGEYIDPYSIAIKKFCKKDIPLSFDMWNTIGASEYDYLNSVSDKLKYRTLSFEEAILGIEGDPFFKAISRTTSAGYPLNMDKTNKMPGKKLWFGNETEYDLNNVHCRRLKVEVIESIIKMKSGERIRVIFTDNLKDETRPVEKVEKGKGRVFSACPLVYFIICRMYFGVFCSWFMRNNISNGSALGVNPYGSGWGQIARRLKRFTPNGEKGIGAGDYSGFDGSQLTQIQDVILDIINKLCNDPESEFMRRMLWNELTNSIHIRGDVIYEWRGSLPSGHPLTPIINCIYNQLSIRYCWLRANNFDYHSLWMFHYYIYLIVMGDDNLFSVHENFRDVFNEMTIHIYMKDIGLTYTSEFKVASIVPLRELEEVSFLKRKFRYEQLIADYVAPLELETILETPYWLHKTIEEKKTTLDLAQWSVDELSLHGKEVFEKWTPLISEACHKRMKKTIDKTYFLECSQRVNKQLYFY